MSLSEIASNIAVIKAHMVEACQRVQRDPASVTLVAVSKQHPPQAILEAMRCGITDFGENRTDEAMLKAPQVNAEAPQTPIWHMIGHIQSRKARDIIPTFRIVHSVDRLKLAYKLAELAQTHAHPLEILLEMNVSGETSKQGWNATNWEQDASVREGLWRDVTEISRLDGLKLRGLMTMAPYTEAPEEARPIFASLARLCAALRTDLGLSLPELSMGMSQDYMVAIEEGATLIRVGTAIFGERTYAPRATPDDVMSDTTAT